MEYPELTIEELARTLALSCTPDSPFYNQVFHHKMFKTHAEWFDGKNGIYPPKVLLGNRVIGDSPKRA
jgi:hypothetical protein